MDVNKIREDFPILKRKINNNPLIYFDNAATSQKPIQVMDAIVDFYQNHNANVSRAIHTLSQEATNMQAEAREKVFTSTTRLRRLIVSSIFWGRLCSG